jgi:hypothetical protein
MEQQGGGVGGELRCNRHQGIGQALGWDGGVELVGPVQRCFADRILQLQGGEQLPAVGGMEIEPQRPALLPLLRSAGRWQSHRRDGLPMGVPPLGFRLVSIGEGCCNQGGMEPLLGPLFQHPAGQFRHQGLAFSLQLLQLRQSRRRLVVLEWSEQAGQLPVQPVGCPLQQLLEAHQAAAAHQRVGILPGRKLEDGGLLPRPARSAWSPSVWLPRGSTEARRLFLDGEGHISAGPHWLPREQAVLLAHNQQLIWGSAARVLVL